MTSDDAFRAQSIPENLDALFYQFHQRYWTGVVVSYQVVSLPPSYQTIYYYPGPAFAATDQSHFQYYVYIPWQHTLWSLPPATLDESDDEHLKTGPMAFRASWTPFHVSDVGTGKIILNRGCLGYTGRAGTLVEAAEAASMWAGVGINHDNGSRLTPWLQRLVNIGGATDTEMRMQTALQTWERLSPQQLQNMHTLRHSSPLTRLTGRRREREKMLQTLVQHPHNAKVMARLDPKVLAA